MLLASPLESAAAQRLPYALPRYEIRAVDVAVFGVGAALAVTPLALAERLPHATCAPCDPSHLWAIDRGAVGDYRRGPGRASDATLVGAVFGGAAFLLDARAGQGTKAKLEDLAVYSQSILLTNVTTSWAKVLFHRPRPVRYSANGANYPGIDNGLSFPSGHSSAAFAAAAAYASILSRRHETRRHAGEIIALFGAATATGVLRVMAHKHFPTDVVAGAVLGTAIGWTVPRLHAVR